MALLISVYQCDKCGKIVALKTERDWNEFRREWHSFNDYQTCSECRWFPKKKRSSEIVELNLAEA